MQRAGRFGSKGGAAALLLACAAPAWAQSVNDYRLPGTTAPPPNPRVQGPVDPDAPVVRTPVPTTTPTATPTAAPPTPAATRPAAAPPPRPGASAAPAAGAPTPRAVPTASDPRVVPSAPGTPRDAAVLPPLGSPAQTAAPQASPGYPVAVPPAAPAAEQADEGAGIWPWIAGLMALIAAAFAALWWFRAREDAADPVITFVPPVVRRPAPDPEPASSAPAPAPAAEAPVAAMSAPNGSGIEVTLEARRMSASLMATTLAYKVVVTNRGAQVLSGLAVEGDMISAHSSLPAEQQIAGDTQTLEPRHALVELAPGESATFVGDFRLPLTSVTPIRAGQAAYFVPLARLRVKASTPAGSPLVSVQTFVVGELPEQPGAALRPFRLDLGPRTYSRIGQRAVN